MEFTSDAREWAMEQFGTCRLGDVRRTRRAVEFAARVAEHPDGSTPDQTEDWGDLKAAYRLFDADAVTFTALAEPHWQRTCASAAGTVLVLDDTTDVNFGLHREVEGLGPTADGRGRGFLLHNALMVDPESEAILGLAGQELFHRKPVPKGDNTYRQTRRPRESEVWGRLVERIGAPPEGARYVHVCDRGGDNVELFCRLVGRDCGWVIRAAQLHRHVLDPDDDSGARTTLQQRVDSAPVLGTYELAVRARKGRPKRTATLEARAVKVFIPRPKKRVTPYLREIGFEGLTAWVVEVREVDPPRGVDEPLHWVLHTSEPVADLADARRIVGWYERRWLVEEFHKALKTGCRLESRMYKTAARLEAVAGLLSVVAVRLLQLKRVAHTDPDRPAENCVPRKWLEMLRALRRRPIGTVRDFFRQLAGLGGHLGRKHDGEPGWITLWRGVKKLHLCLRGHDAMRRCG